MLIFATKVGHKQNWIAADKVVDTLRIEEGYSALGRSFERGTAVVHTVVDSHDGLGVGLVNAAETERTERVADIGPTECKVQAGGNWKIVDNAEIADEIVKRCGSGGAA